MLNIESFGIPSDVATKIVEAVAIGEYSLLLGAGFSLGAHNSKGVLLPKSEKLAEELKAQFSLLLEIEGAGSLPVAYEDAIDAAGFDEVSNFLQKRLTGCTPAWHSIASKLEWRRVWTLNIDDLPESIYSAGNVRHINFDEKYRPLSDTDDLQVIYLHGRAKTKSAKIFSIQEYHDTVRSPGDWHSAFFTDFKERPFIACGASLTGEFDLAKTLRSGNQSGLSRGLPSLAVVKDIDPAARQRLQNRLGLIPVSSSAEDFFTALLQDVKEIIRQNPDILPATVPANDARKFGQQFQPLYKDKNIRVDSRHDFYSGDEPQWSDIVSAKDAELTFSQRAVNALNGKRPGVVPVVALTGDPGCGKSTALLHVCQAISKSSRVFLFRGEEDVAVDACINSIKGPRPVLLAFDDAADFSVAISHLADKGAKLGIPLSIVLADRSRRDRGITVDLAGQQLEKIDHSSLTPSDALAVVRKRRTAGRLGSVSSESDQEIRKLISQKHHGNLLSALSDIEPGHGFSARLTSLLSILPKNHNIKLLAVAVSLTHRWGYPLPLHYAAIASGISSDAVAKMCTAEGELADVFVLERKGVRFRHRVLSEKFFNEFSDVDLLCDVSMSLVAAISPMVNIQAIRSKSYPHRLAKVLTDRKGVMDMVRGNLTLARDWYAGVKDYFGWNSRYWEQRALLEAEAHNYSAAYSYASLAVSKERHAFPYTTLGKVCLAYGATLIKESVSEGFEKYQEGNAALLEAFAIAQSRPETIFHPITTFFEFSEKIYILLESRPDLMKTIRGDWEGWLESARSSGFFNRFPNREEVIQGKFLKMGINSR